MPKYDAQPERILNIHTPDQKKPIRIEAWKYYEIVDELRCRGVDYQNACDAAKWAGRVRESNVKYTQIPHYILTVM